MALVEAADYDFQKLKVVYMKNKEIK